MQESFLNQFVRDPKYRGLLVHLAVLQSELGMDAKYLACSVREQEGLQYQAYVNPDTVSGIGISLQMVFGVIAGGMFVMLGPTFGAVFLLALQEVLRVLIGNQIHGLDLLIYGALLVFFIIRMPKGILGSWLERKT